MAGKKKQAISPEKMERRSSPRVLELRQKALDEKERLARERISLLRTEICVDKEELHAEEDGAVNLSPKRKGRSRSPLPTMHKGQEKLDFYGSGDEDAHLKVTKNLRFFNKQYLLMVQVCLFSLSSFSSF